MKKPTKFFCNLENKNFIEKTVKKLQTNTGKMITHQKELLENIKSYYTCLFKNKDSTLSEANLHKLLKNVKINKVSDSSLGNILKEEELGRVLRTMKNNK